ACLKYWIKRRVPPRTILFPYTTLFRSSGYVLDYSDATYGEFFSRYKIDIHSHRYQIYGTSKAKKMRAFWELEPDYVVAPVLAEIDRKSTRLNSSHVKISYAVFCLHK